MKEEKTRLPVFNLYLSTLTLSFVPQRHHGIDLRGLSRRQVTGKQGHGEQQQRNCDNRHEVVWRNPEKHAGDEAAGSHSTGNSKRYSDETQRERFSKHEP